MPHIRGWAPHLIKLPSSCSGGKESLKNGKMKGNNYSQSEQAKWKNTPKIHEDVRIKKKLTRVMPAQTARCNID